MLAMLLRVFFYRARAALTGSGKERLDENSRDFTTYKGLYVWGRCRLRGWRTPRTRVGCLLDSSNYWCLRDQSTNARNSTVLVAWSLKPSPSYRPSRAVTARHSCATRCSGPVRCAGFGQGGICRHSSLTGLPGWANEIACLQRMQTGAIKASLR